MNHTQPLRGVISAGTKLSLPFWGDKEAKGYKGKASSIFNHSGFGERLHWGTILVHLKRKRSSWISEYSLCIFQSSGKFCNSTLFIKFLKMDNIINVFLSLPILAFTIHILCFAKFSNYVTRFHFMDLCELNPVINICVSHHLLEFLFLCAESEIKLVEIEINLLISSEIFNHISLFYLNILKSNK